MKAYFSRLSLFTAILILSAPFAEAAPKKAQNEKKPGQTKAPFSSSISRSMAGARWTMSEEQLFGKFETQIREKYKPELAKAKGAVEEDRIRRRMNDDIEKIKTNRVKFDGQKTGWDASFLKREYAHNQGESMIVANDENSQNFYFFKQDKLWKWFKAFNADVFAGKSFKDFRASVEGRFGPGLEHHEPTNGPYEDPRDYLEWQDSHTRLRAIDLTKFYGFYCLVFEDKQVLKSKSASTPRGLDPSAWSGSSRGLVDAVTQDKNAEEDANADIADRITGHIRNRTDAKATPTPPKPDSVDAHKGDKKSGSPAPASSGQKDPFKGLDL